jgi:hypothetical protein
MARQQFYLYMSGNFISRLPTAPHVGALLRGKPIPFPRVIYTTFRKVIHIRWFASTG